MHEPTESELMTTLMARCDAMTWVTTTLIQSHPQLDQVAAAWHARHLLARNGTMDEQPIGYMQVYIEELAAWTNIVEELARRRRQGD